MNIKIQRWDFVIGKSVFVGAVWRFGYVKEVEQDDKSNPHVRFPTVLLVQTYLANDSRMTMTFKDSTFIFRILS